MAELGSSLFDGVICAVESSDIVRPLDAFWNVDRLNQVRGLDGVGANEGPYIGRGVNIFHFDTGIDTTHQEFGSLPGQKRTVANVASFALEDIMFQPEWGWNDGDGFVADNDVDAHGTHTAGTAAGRTAGLAPGANLWGIKVISDVGVGFTDWQLSAYDAVASVVKSGVLNGTPTLITASVGGTCRSGNVTYCVHDTPYARAINDMWDLGVPVVVAAGNSGDDACFYNPGATEKAINVGSTDVDDNVVSHSNYGSCVDIMAPGKDIPSAAASSIVGNEYEDFVDDVTNDYRIMSGTSMAAPAVAGVIAQYAEAMELGSDARPAVDAMLLGATKGVLKLTNYRCRTNNLIPRTPNDVDHVPITDQKYVPPSCALPRERPSFYVDDDDFYSAFVDDDDDVDDEASDDGNFEADMYNITEFGWCSSSLDKPVYGSLTPTECWAQCSAKFGTELVAADFYEPFFCYCQNDCECMLANDGGTLIVSENYTLPKDCAINCVDDCYGCDELFNFECGLDCTPSERAENLLEYCDIDVGPVIDPVPTLSPTLPYSNESCFDRRGWHKIGVPEFNCSWVAEFLPTRCAVKGNTGFAYEGCPVTCDSCPHRSCSEHSLIDSTTWHSDKDGGGCDMVAKDSQQKCKSFGIDNETFAYAFEACPQACHLCVKDSDECVDDSTWMLNSDMYGMSKACDWVAMARSDRCKKLSKKSKIGAYSACKVSCGLCEATCENEDTWMRKGGNADMHCGWVAEAPKYRCSQPGEDINLSAATDKPVWWAYEACRDACLCRDSP